MKTCYACGKEKPLTGFCRDASKPDERKSSCRECNRHYQLSRRYGITPKVYQQMLEAQGRVCAICREACSSGQRLAVDHCHETNRVRGLLCGNCNRAIGKLKDDIDLLRSAIEYLEGADGP